MALKHVSLIFAIAAIALIQGIRPAHAYLDPGTGSLIVQGVLGAIAGATITIGLYWARLKNFFFKKNTAKRDADKSSNPK